MVRLWLEELVCTVPLTFQARLKYLVIILPHSFTSPHKFKKDRYREKEIRGYWGHVHVQIVTNTQMTM